jgi:hypothetical protein
MKVSTENDNNFGYEKIMILLDNIPLTKIKFYRIDRYIRITLSELFDQQFKIGNVFK